MSTMAGAPLWHRKLEGFILHSAVKVVREQMMDSIRTILAGGSPLLQAGIASALAQCRRVRIVGRLRDVHDGGDSELLGCDVLVLSTDCPHLEVSPILERLARVSAAARLLVLTGNGEHEEALETLRLGVRGYGICTAMGAQDLCDAVVSLARWGFWICPSTLEHLLATALQCSTAQDAIGQSASLLSPRELEVLRLFYRGASEENIARSLCLSRNTVKTYLRRIREKLHADSRSDAVACAVERGLLPNGTPRTVASSATSPVRSHAAPLSPRLSPTGVRT